jgi:DNA/RNA-binding domain of Phe-tRNA-synthetase-like protein
MPSEEGEREKPHDAELVVRDTRKGLIIAWRWTDGRRTVTPTEHEEMTNLIRETETRCNPEEYDGDDVISQVWINDDETIREVEWSE